LGKRVHQRAEIVVGMEAAGEQDEGTIQRQAEVGASTPAIPWRKDNITIFSA